MFRECLIGKNKLISLCGGGTISVVGQVQIVYGSVNDCVCVILTFVKWNVMEMQKCDTVLMSWTLSL